MFLSKKNAGVYHLFYVDETGRRRSRSTGARTKAEAVKFLRSFNAEEDLKRRAIKHVTLEQFSVAYLSYSQSVNTPKTVESNRSALNELSRVLGFTCVIGKITPADCERFLAVKTVEASAWTARKYFLSLGAAFERARIWGHIEENPWRKVKKPKTPEALPGFFTREQFRSVLAVIKSRNLKELLTIAFLTGLRRGELLAMEWDWIDFQRGILTVKNSETFTTMNKRARVVPLSQEALTLLISRRERMNADHGLVFHWKGRPLAKNRVSENFKKAVVRVGLPKNLHFHSIRHSFASLLVREGVSLFQVGKLLGHSSTSVTEIYAHLVPADMHHVLSPLHLNN